MAELPYDEEVGKLSGRMVLKDLIAWLGHARVCTVACTDQPNIVLATNQLTVWLDGDEPIPLLVEDRLRLLLKAVLLMEGKRGTMRMLQTLDGMTEESRPRTLLRLFGEVEPERLERVVTAIRRWASEQ